MVVPTGITTPPRITWKTRLVFQFMRGFKRRSTYYHMMMVGVNPQGSLDLVMVTPELEVITHVTLRGGTIDALRQQMAAAEAYQKLRDE